MTDTQALAGSLAQAGHRLYDEARGHMRSARYHRARARDLYAQVEIVAGLCSAHGIKVDFSIPEPAPTSQGDASGTLDGTDDD